MSEALLPIQERRPADLQTAIDEKFLAVSAALPNYTYHGSRNAYEYEPLTSSVSIIAALQREAGDKPLRALDVGTGVGGFITGNNWGENDVIHGITAYDYRRNPNFAHHVRASDDAYKVGNAENLNTISGLLPTYDLLVSRWTLRHFIDPVGALEEMANHVDADGILAVDGFRWQTTSDNHEANFAAVLEALDDAGYDLNPPFDPEYGRTMTRAFESSAITDLVIRRTEVKQPVRIPFDVTLDHDEDRSFSRYSLR